MQECWLVVRSKSVLRRGGVVTILRQFRLELGQGSLLRVRQMPEMPSEPAGPYRSELWKTGSSQRVVLDRSEAACWVCSTHGGKGWGSGRHCVED